MIAAQTTYRQTNENNIDHNSSENVNALAPEFLDKSLKNRRDFSSRGAANVQYDAIVPHRLCGRHGALDSQRHRT